MKSVMVTSLVLQSLLSGIELTAKQVFILLCVLGIAIFTIWLCLQFFIKGIRDASRKNMMIVSSISLTLFFVGVIGYVLLTNLGYKLGFLRGYDVYFYTMLLLIALVLSITVLLMYWNEIRWQRRTKAQLEALRKETKTLQEGVKQTETKEDETGQLFEKIRGEVEEFQDVYEEFKEK